MHCAILQLIVAYVAHVHAKEPSATHAMISHDFVDKLADGLIDISFDRVLNSLSFQRTHTGKPMRETISSHLPFLRQRRVLSDHSPGILCGMLPRSSRPCIIARSSIWKFWNFWKSDASLAKHHTDNLAGHTAPNATVASDFHRLLLSRRTVNDFSPELPAAWEEAMLRAVKAATFAPNHRRTEPWRFHLLGPQAIRRVCELNSEIVAAKKGEEAGAKKLKRWLAIPGWLVVTCVCDDGAGASMDDPTGIPREDYAACCCAVQNLCLSLHAEGIGTKWTTGPVNFDSRFGKAVGLPSNEYVVGTIWFGAAAKQPSVPLKKLSLEEVFCRHG